MVLRSSKINGLFSPFSFFFFFFIFLGPHLQHVEILRLGVKSELQLKATPQPQQPWIQATSVTYTTAQGNAGSLTHWARPGIEPTTSWFLVIFGNHWAMRGTPYLFLFFFHFIFLGPYPQGVKLELQLSAYATATAMQDPSHVCDLHVADP